VSHQSIVGKVGKFNVCFREVILSSHAGLALLDDFAQQLGVAQIMDEALHVKQRERGYRESEAVMSLSHNLISGGSCLLDLDVLRGDVGTRHLLGQARLMAPTTAGEFLRKFDIGDIHDLYRAQHRLQARVRPHQAATCCTLDVDSSVYEQASTRKQGSVKAYNGAGESAGFSNEVTGGKFRTEITARDTWVYYTYNDYIYTNTQLEITAENLGANTNYVGLVCRYSDSGWYELNVLNTGEYFVYGYDTANQRLRLRLKPRSRLKRHKRLKHHRRHKPHSLFPAEQDNN